MMRGLHVPSHLFLLVFSATSLIHLEVCLAQPPTYRLKGPVYPLTPFPLLDSLNVPQAFKNRHYLKFLLKCVFFEGHCDIMGKWLKPRAMAGLFGTCLGCTEFQKQHINEWLELLIDKNPEEFRAAMIKVCVDLELPVGEQDLRLIQSYYS